MIKICSVLIEFWSGEVLALVAEVEAEVADTAEKALDEAMEATALVEETAVECEVGGNEELACSR